MKNAPKEVAPTEEQFAENAQAMQKLYGNGDAPHPVPSSPLDLILKDPARINEIDTERLAELVEMYSKERAFQAEIDFNAAFLRCIRAFTPVRKRGKNIQKGKLISTYAFLEDVYAMMLPIITSEGFSQSISTEDSGQKDHIRFVLKIRHEAGHKEEHRFDLPIDEKGPGGGTSKTRLHGSASSYTYATRYLTTKVWQIAQIEEHDDDGNAAAGLNESGEPFTITSAQKAELIAYVEQTGTDLNKVLMTYGVTSVDDLPTVNFAAAMNMLHQRAKMQKEAQNAG